MTYKEKLSEAMHELARNEKVLFIGQGLFDDDCFYGTLNGIKRSKMLEMPCAEILSTGVAIGLALTGWIPVLLFQRMDFMLLASDQILNHAALFERMSGGKIKVPMIIRACVGSQDMKFDVGDQHRKDFSSLFEGYIGVLRLTKETLLDNKESLAEYLLGYGKPIMTVEYKDSYGLA